MKRQRTRRVCARICLIFIATALVSQAATAFAGAESFGARPTVRAVEEAARLAPRLRGGLLRTASNARPVDGSGPIGMHYGDAPASFVDGGSHVRIWYVTEGPHAVPGLDDNANELPDFVERFATLAEEIASAFDVAGWRRPLADTARGLHDDGGDDRFDVYLLDFGGSADGLFYREFCDGTPAVCGGYMAVENDFVGYHYDSHDDAIRTLFSHEYAHAVGAAYADGTAAWWDEGFAVWAELAYGPVEADVERLMARWFRTPERPLDAPVQPGDSWPYAASAFLVFVADTFGAEVFQDAWMHLADGSAKSATGGLDAALASRGDSLDSAWTLFATASWFTGARASEHGEGTALRWASRFAQLDADALILTDEPVEVQVPKWSVRAVTLNGLAPGAHVEAGACDGVASAALTLVSPDGQAATPLVVGVPRGIGNGSVLLLAGRTRAGASQCVTLARVAAPSEPTCETRPCDLPECADGSCAQPNDQRAGGCSQSRAPSTPWTLVGLVGFCAGWMRRRWRREDAAVIGSAR